MTNRDMTRREFTRNTVLATGCVAAGLSGNFLAQASDEDAIKKTRSYNPEMEYRRLGRTGLWVSAVCLGGHFKKIGEKLGHNIPLSPLPSDPVVLKDLLKNRHDVVSRCIDVGINYVDACTLSEVGAYGPALKGRRDKMYMGFAMWPHCPRKEEFRTAEVLLKTLDQGLKAANVDYVDVWRLVARDEMKHEPGSDEMVHTPAEEEEFIKAFEIAKKAGKVRFTGVSSHCHEWLTRLATNYPEHYQVLLFPYSTQTKELAKDSLFDAVRKHDIGTFGIKPFTSNALFAGAKDQEEKNRRARLTIRYILCNPAITAPIPGLACVEEVDNMAKAIKEHRRLDMAELNEVEQMSQQAMAALPPKYEWLRDWEYV